LPVTVAPPYNLLMPHAIVLDTDMGSDVDDALCLALAMAAPEIELVAITHVCGDTRLRAQISRRLLDLAERREVPVYAGRSRALDNGDRFVWFDHEGVGILDGVPTPVPDDDAVDVLCRLLRARTDLEVVAVGPLTNIAAALASDASIASRIAQLTLMGGCVREVRYGGVTFPPAFDYNLCADPEASRHVLSAGIPTRIVPIDVTMQVWIAERDVQALAAAAAGLSRALAAAVRRWTPGMTNAMVTAGADPAIDNAAFLHDPLALACAYDESFCTFEDLWIEPCIEDGVFRTRERPQPGAGVYRIRCATAVDSDRFLNHFRARVIGRDPPRERRWFSRIFR
jgi:purine nucleosidase